MIDLRLLRSDPEKVKQAWERRGASFDLGPLLALDTRHRALLAEVEALRARHNQANKAIAAAEPLGRPGAIEGAKTIASELAGLEDSLRNCRDELNIQLQAAPNLVHPDAPPGRGDESNRLVEQVGDSSPLSFEAQDHLEIGTRLGIIDVDRAAKVSGSRFAFLMGKAALLEMALVRFAFELLQADSFVPVIPPVLVRREAMEGTGFFPTDEAQVYKTDSDDLYLAGTSEVPIASMHSGEVMPAERLPLRYAGFSTCFRREAGTYGKDTRGIIRVHQFDKVEMFSFCLPEGSDQEHSKLLEMEKSLFTKLEIPFRVIEICAGDLAAPNYRKFDLEAWLPGSKRWLEMTSCSNDIDYQARRLQIRTKTPGGNQPVHTLNGTALAIQRAIVAILENHQQPDGSVRIPKALTPHTTFDRIVPG